MQGWVKIHREIFESDIWHDVTAFRLFVYLIGKACHKDGVKYKGMTLKQGQFIRSYRKLADDMSYKEGRGLKSYSISTIKRTVKRLIDSGRVTVSDTEYGTLFTIVNYAKYQGLQHDEEVMRNGTGNEVGTNEELMGNEVGTKSEQDQECKELKNVNNAEVKEEEEEQSALDDTFNDQDIKTLIQFFEQNGFGVIGSYVMEKMIDWLEVLPVDVILHAMKIAVEQGAKTWRYVEKVLVDWQKRGFDSLEKVEAAQKEYEEKQSKRKAAMGNRKPVRKEQLPDWFDKRDQEHEQVKQQNDPDFEERRKRLIEIQKKYAKNEQSNIRLVK